MADPLPSVSTPPDSPRAPRFRRWRHYAIEALIFIAVLFVIQAWQGRDVPDGPAPAFEASWADGSRSTLATWRNRHPGKVTGLYFWAEWCPICSTQEGSIDALHADWPVLTVAMQSGAPAKVAEVLAARGLDWQTAVDSDGRIAADYGLRGVPAFIVIAPDGTIRSVAVGYTTEAGMRLRLWWAQLTS